MHAGADDLPLPLALCALNRWWQVVAQVLQVRCADIVGGKQHQPGLPVQPGPLSSIWQSWLLAEVSQTGLALLD